MTHHELPAGRVGRLETLGDGNSWISWIYPSLGFVLFWRFFTDSTLPETNIAPENRPDPKRKLVFQSSIFRCKLLESSSNHHLGEDVLELFFQPL